MDDSASKISSPPREFALAGFVPASFAAQCAQLGRLDCGTPSFVSTSAVRHNGIISVAALHTAPGLVLPGQFRACDLVWFLTHTIHWKTLIKKDFKRLRPLTFKHYFPACHWVFSLRLKTCDNIKHVWVDCNAKTGKMLPLKQSGLSFMITKIMEEPKDSVNTNLIPTFRRFVFDFDIV